MKKLLLAICIIAMPTIHAIPPISPQTIGIGIIIFSDFSFEVLRCHEKLKEKERVERKIKQLNRKHYHSTKIQNDLMFALGEKHQIDRDIDCITCELVRSAEEKVKNISRRYT